MIILILAQLLCHSTLASPLMPNCGEYEANGIFECTSGVKCIFTIAPNGSSKTTIRLSKTEKNITKLSGSWLKLRLHITRLPDLYATPVGGFEIVRPEPDHATIKRISKEKCAI